MIKNSCILKIYKKNLLKNYHSFKNKKTNLIVAPTIKANAYGLGDIKVFNLFKKEGCKYFFVATLEEGIKLKNKNKKIFIYVLNGIQNYNLKLFKDNNIIPIINTRNELKKITKTNLKFGLHIDTGINRLGIDYRELPKSIFNNQKIDLIMSHFASADKINSKYNDKQNEIFSNIIKKFSKKKLIYSLSNSNGATISKKYLYNMIRPGIGIYGGNNKNILLKKIIYPVVCLKAKIIQIKTIRKNEFIGYNQTYKTNNRIKVAIIGIGYADGIPRKLSNNGCVYYKKSKFKIIGRISMDSLTINISNSKHILKVGNYVDLINFSHGIEDFADQCDTISNEVITSLGERVKKIYV